MSLARLSPQPAPARRPALSVVSTNPVETLIARLDRVRKSGRGWTAKCPAHEDRTASLSITAGDDGRVLLHCFAGCCTADVVAAAGLQIADLFVRKPTADMTFAERAALKEHGRQAQWRAALNVLSLESKIVQIAAREMAKGKPLTQEDCARVIQASTLIDHAQGVLCGQSS
jgi:hypothetical protein